MPSLKEIKTRIASVNNTRKITSAMKMVASSKLHHAQLMIANTLPYEDLLEHILKSFLVSTPNAETPFEVERGEIKSVALVVYASNSSLCGGFNANVLKMMQQVIDDYKSLGVEKITIYPIGRKVAERVSKLRLKSAGNFVELADKPNAQQCQSVADEIMGKYVDHEFDKVELIYYHFKSAGSQILTRKTFLPIDISTELAFDDERDLSSNNTSAKAQEYLREKNNAIRTKELNAQPLNDDFIVEPDLGQVLGSLVPRQLHFMLYTALLDSNASEHAARMVSMQTATDNADDMLRDLSLQYNKSRQQAITNELLDIVGGSVNN